MTPGRAAMSAMVSARRASDRRRNPLVLLALAALTTAKSVRIIKAVSFSTSMLSAAVPAQFSNTTHSVRDSMIKAVRRRFRPRLDQASRGMLAPGALLREARRPPPFST